MSDNGTGIDESTKAQTLTTADIRKDSSLRSKPSSADVFHTLVATSGANVKSRSKTADREPRYVNLYEKCFIISRGKSFSMFDVQGEQ